MASITPALVNLRPGVNFSNPDNVLAKVRWEAPLPEGFTPPTQQELDAEIARLAAAPVETLKQRLESKLGMTIAEANALLAGGK